MQPIFLSALVLSLLAGALGDTVNPDTAPETNVHRVPLSALQSSESVSYHVPAAPPPSHTQSHAPSHAPSHVAHHTSHASHASHRSHGSHAGHGLYASSASSSSSSSQRRFPAIAMLFPTTLTPYQNNPPPPPPASSVHMRDSHTAKYQNSELPYESRRPTFSSEVVPQAAARQPQSYSQVGKVHHFGSYSHPPVEPVEKRPHEPTYDVSGVHEAPGRFLFDRQPAPVAPEHERPRPAPVHHSYEPRDKQQVHRGLKYAVNDLKPNPFQPEKPEEPREYEPRPVKYSSIQNAEELFGAPGPFRTGRQEIRPEERPEFVREAPKQPEQQPYRYGRNHQDGRLEETPSNEKATTFQGYPIGLLNSMNIPSAGVSSSATGGGSASSRRRYNLVYIPVDVLKKLLTEAGYKKKK
ncbi:uncharacterized protein LOC135370588 [Ornithodoros turicata]|uniref:uncharacterized protein LOC135370588 n=1 Tax=Ornithodoros turicata TaxID=34597 RepID=UPI0031393749